MSTSRPALPREQFLLSAMVSSFGSFWLLVYSVASLGAVMTENVVRVLTALAVVLLVAALWVPRLRASALGAVGGIAVAGGLVVLGTLALRS